MLTKFYLFMLVLLLPSIACATGTISSYPYSESFDTDNWSGTICKISAGAGGTCTYATSGCYSGGCVKLTPPTTGQNVTGIDYNVPESKRVNTRVLIKVGPTYEETAVADSYGYQNKFYLLHRYPENDNRGMAIFERYDSSPYYYTWGACRDNDCNYQCGGEQCSFPNGSDAFKSTDYSDEWVCIEIEQNLTDGIAKTYLWTQDGVFNGEYATHAITDLTLDWTYFYMGGFFNGHHTADANNYIMLDSLVVSNTYIGPPEGFTGSTVPVVTGCTLSGASMQ